MGDGKVCVDGVNDGDLQTDKFSKRGRDWFVEGNELDNFPNKKQVKETSNDQVYSEVSNPNLSPKEVVSSFEPVEVASNLQGCGDITPTSLGDSSAESWSDEHSGVDTSAPPEPMSSVVVEIPKQACTSGIRKITFKFSKSKEDRINNESRLNPPAVEDRSQNMNVSSNGTVFVDAVNFHADTANMDLKVTAVKYPSNVKKLLSTGILEGARVKYISSTGELSGIVRREGYLCGCSKCNFSKVLSAFEFELHAGGKSRHPNAHIFMENGKPIYSIIQKLRDVPLSARDDMIRDVAGSSFNEEAFRGWKANIEGINNMLKAKENEMRFPSGHCPAVSIPSLDLKEISGANGFPGNLYSKHQTDMDWQMRDESMYMMNRPTSEMSNFGAYKRRTAEGAPRRRDNDLHRLLFKPNGLPDGAEVAYYIKGQKILGGYKQGNGIVCSCCDNEISPSQFESHAGWAARRQPYRHIYTSNGQTLHDIAMSLAKGHSIATGGSDDMCATCGDGGDLMLCKGCPRAFHADCLDSQCIKEGDLYCTHCKDKFAPTTKDVTQECTEASRPIIIRLSRIVKSPESESGGCVVCRANDFSAAIFDDRTVIICDQCEKEFHVGCLRSSGLCDLKELPKDKWFCTNACNKIYVTLQNLASKGPEIVPRSSSIIAIQKHTEKGHNYITPEDIQIQIFSGKSRRQEHLPILSRATAIFRECFDPIVASSGRDLIPVMVYGRNISGQEFGGMYCIVLTVKSVVVSAGLLRIFGREAAELPLVATTREYQGQGYFQVLFSCIERLLFSLEVETLLLPAAEDALSIWTKKLGFQKMSVDRVSKLTRDLQITGFKGTTMLEKPVQQIT